MNTDFIISWDISDKDYPTISVAKMGTEKSNIKVDVIGISHEQSGVFSLLQLLEEFERKTRAENEGQAERLKKELSAVRADYEALQKRFYHLTKSVIIRKYDICDPKTHQYKHDILSFDKEYQRNKSAYETLLSCTNCNECVKQHDCEYIEWGDRVVYNCPHYKKKQ